jgi:glycogen debranching enzyme
MTETLINQEPFTVLATEPQSDERTRVLKNGESFAVFDHAGNIAPMGLGELGLYHEGTRFLSRLELLLEGSRPLLLSSTVRQDSALIVDLTNPDVKDGVAVILPKDTLHLFGMSFLWEGACYVRWRVRNYGATAVPLRLALLFSADFVDVFEVRGMQRTRRGLLRPAEVSRDEVALSYEGLDGTVRRTRLVFTAPPSELTGTHALFRESVPGHGEKTLELVISCEIDRRAPHLLSFDEALGHCEGLLLGRQTCCATVQTSNDRFDEWADRSAADLSMMTTETPYGPYPYAGVPWFSTAFGRDGIITALEILWANPEPARGVLDYLAATQAIVHDPENDAEPGKILHEMRDGEMAALREVPFGRYYGTVDATPLFVVLAGAYYERTGDLARIEKLWPHIEAALSWIDRDGDLDGDGFIEYSRRSSNGLSSQGWKDSVDSVSHADGRLAEGPIALCEVQGYAFAARIQAAALARLLGHDTRAAELLRQAAALRESFERAFWCEELSTYAIALDGEKRRCAVISSNAGQVLFTGIASPERARRVAGSLMSATSFSGWGIRTLDASEPRYNPMSYHNGSVWPHDNALIAWGMARYGLKRFAVQVLSGLFDASMHMDLQRMPELFCGFPRRPHEGPTRYPVACSPQSWAAGAVFLLLQSCLGLEIDAPRRQIRLLHPELPGWLKRVSIHNLRVGEASVDVRLRRYDPDVGVSLERREGDVELIVVK